MRSLWPGILGGLLLSLPGVIPSLALDWGVDRATAQAAHQIYVFERLPHHLTLERHSARLHPSPGVALAMFWLLLGRWSRRARLPDDRRQPLASASGVCRRRGGDHAGGSGRQFAGVRRSCAGCRLVAVLLVPSDRRGDPARRGSGGRGADCWVVERRFRARQRQRRE